MTAPANPVRLAQEEITRNRGTKDPYAKPAWMQQQESEQERLNRANPTVATPNTGIPESAWAERLRMTNEAGTTLTQGVVGAQATKRAQKAERDLAQWKQAQQESLAQIQNSFQTQMAGLQDSYASSMNAGLQSANGAGQQLSAGQYQFADAQDAQVAAWARQAGWAESDLPMLMGIYRGESGGNVNAINNKNRNGSVDYGLMQINTIHRGSNYIPQGFYEGGWKDPVKNLQAALGIYKGAGNKWTPWSVYNNGTAQKYKAQYTLSGSPTVVPSQTITTASGQLRTSIVNKAMEFIGTPYVFGGNSLTKGIDCSGLVHEVYKLFGFSSMRTADGFKNTQSWGQQYGGTKKITGTQVPINQLQPGDLVTWTATDNSTHVRMGAAHHVAIYAGNGQIIEAPQAGVPVRRRSIRQNEMSRLTGIAVNFG